MLYRQSGELLALVERDGVGEDDESVRMLVLGTANGLLEITGRPYLQRLHLHAQRAGGALSVAQKRIRIGLRRVPQDGEVRELRDALLEQLYSLPAELWIDCT